MRRSSSAAPTPIDSTASEAITTLVARADRGQPSTASGSTNPSEISTAPMATKCSETVIIISSIAPMQRLREPLVRVPRPPGANITPSAVAPKAMPQVTETSTSEGT